jgi:DnaK suppressor protein
MESLTLPQQATLRAQLEQRRDELEAQLAADPVHGELVVTEVETSPVDKATNRLLNDLALEAAGHHSAALRDVRAALARMDDGSYGMCEQCGNEIGFSRLQARPEAPLCIACQTRAERK